jgi:hypothetical protein
MSAIAVAVIDDGNAPRLPSRQVVALEHGDFEAALNQLVRGAHPGDAAAQYNDPSRHVSRRHALRFPSHLMDLALPLLPQHDPVPEFR